jgi:hypothetical protein
MCAAADPLEAYAGLDIVAWAFDCRRAEQVEAGVLQTGLCWQSQHHWVLQSAIQII